MKLKICAVTYTETFTIKVTRVLDRNVVLSRSAQVIDYWSGDVDTFTFLIDQTRLFVIAMMSFLKEIFLLFDDSMYGDIKNLILLNENISTRARAIYLETALTNKVFHRFAITNSWQLIYSL